MGVEITQKMIEYLRGRLWHRVECPANERPSAMEAALMGRGQHSEKEYKCTCGVEEIRKLVGRSW